jgi:hypothetical protein
MRRWNMHLLNDRIMSNSDTTIGQLFIDDIFECYTLEDEYRAVKVWGETRIPANTYEIQLRTTGGFHQRYLKRFPTFHVGMLQIMNVPNFNYVLIHILNTEKETNGCLGVGKELYDWKLVKSTEAYEKMYKQVAAALLQHEEVTIEYRDSDLNRG